MTDAASPKDPQRGSMGFRRSAASRPKLPKDEARRQGEITLLAFTLLGGRDQALAFLNNADKKLGGRPLDLAIANKEGFFAVEREIRRLASESGKEE